MINLLFDTGEVFRRLSDASQALGDLTPLYEDIGEQQVTATDNRFRTGTAPDGTRWRQKAPATLAAYLSAGKGNRPDPLIGELQRLWKGIHYLASRDGVEIGSNQEYSGVMQFGAAKGAFGRDAAGRPLPWGDIPARPFLGLSHADEEAIIAATDEYLRDAIDGR